MYTVYLMYCIPSLIKENMEMNTISEQEYDEKASS